MSTSATPPRLAPPDREDATRSDAPLPRADEPSTAGATAGPRRHRIAPPGVHVRLSVGLSVLIHGVAIGLALWLGLPGEPEATSIGAALPQLAVAPLLEPEPPVPVEVELDELVVLDEPPEVRPELPPTEDLEPPEDFEVDPRAMPPPVEMTDVPIHVASLRVPPRQPPPLVRRPRPPPPPRVARPRPPRPVRAAVRPTPMRVVYAPDIRRYYPAEARRLGLTGSVQVEIVVDARGIVTQATILRSSGSALLDAAARHLVSAYRFTPGTGLRSTRIPVSFQLL